MGAAYGTAKSGVGIASMGVMRPELVMKSIVPVVMAGVLGIYGLIIAVIISTGGESASNVWTRLQMASTGCLELASLLNSLQCMAGMRPVSCSLRRGCAWKFLQADCMLAVCLVGRL